jgi:hypothetical protein
MWSRRLVIAAALATWLAPAAVEAGPSTTKTASTKTASTKTASTKTARKKTTKKPSKAARAKAARAKAARAKRTRLAKRRRYARASASHSTDAVSAVGHDLSSPANMPDGWSWPPTPEMTAAGAACTARLDELGVEWKPAEPVERVVTPITVPSMTFGDVKLVSWFRKPPFVMDCHLALGLVTFAKDLYELGVREVKFSRIYGYTLVRTGGVTKNALSRHALGLAVDVRSVIDADGREAVVATDYKLDDPLLVRLEAFLNDSGGFRTVLTPKNDPVSHHDHFHVEVKLEYGP